MAVCNTISCISKSNSKSGSKKSPILSFVCVFVSGPVVQLFNVLKAKKKKLFNVQIMAIYFIARRKQHLFDSFKIFYSNSLHFSCANLSRHLFQQPNLFLHLFPCQRPTDLELEQENFASPTEPTKGLNAFMVVLIYLWNFLPLFIYFFSPQASNQIHRSLFFTEKTPPQALAYERLFPMHERRKSTYTAGQLKCQKHKAFNSFIRERI